MSNRIVLDTHILIWSLIAPEELSQAIKSQIVSAQNSGTLYISSISLWEIAMLIQKKRINIFRRTSEFLKAIALADGLNIMQIGPEVAAESVALPEGFTGDPADNLIIASTREVAGQLITRDQRIIDWAQHGHLKVIKG